jgi:hypothetical protein
MSLTRWLAPIACALMAPLAGCNALTGADDISFGDEEGERTGSGSGSGGSTGTGGEGQGGVGNGQVTGGGDTGGTTQQPLMVEAAGVTINEISLYQGVRRPLVEGGVPVSSNIPIVAGRDALVRVFVSLDGAYNGLPITARFLVEGQPPVETQVTPSGNPQESQLSSTINFDVPAALMISGASYRIELLQPPEQSPGGNPGAAFPGAGAYTPLSAQNTGTLKVVLVPVQYTADGSNRMPDTSATQVQRYVDRFYAMYPVSNADITVHAPVAWDGAISANGSGWDTLLNSLADFRIDDNASADTYYYGIFAPASSMGQYCSGGCVAGLGFVGGPADNYTRTAIGLGFSGDGAVDTAVHEVGHNHGRNHAPCGGPAGVDQSFPYAGASIGVWGYDLVTRDLKNPSSFTDMMGYCDPAWVSDYTFNALFNRVKAVTGANMIWNPELLNQTWERVKIGGDGPEFLDPITLPTPPLGTTTSITAVTQTGTVNLEGQFFAYDHIEGGVLFWKQTDTAVSSVSFQQLGKLHQLVK